MTPAAWTIAPVSANHYENFPVASVLRPPALRAALLYLHGTTSPQGQRQSYAISTAPGIPRLFWRALRMRPAALPAPREAA
jgi:hypothetical protein